MHGRNSKIKQNKPAISWEQQRGAWPQICKHASDCYFQYPEHNDNGHKGVMFLCKWMQKVKEVIFQVDSVYI